MNSEIINLKGIKGGIMVILRDDASFDEILKLIPQKLQEILDFLVVPGSRLAFSGRMVGGIDKIKLEQAVMKVAPEHISIEYQDDDPVMAVQQSIKNDKNQFYHGTLRSGQALRSSSNLVVVGDVNPGAELIAVGNVIVMGILRGIVHAGYNGDKEAIIVAAKMAPTQLRIADIITRPPDDEISDNWIPEIAYIKDGNIYIDDYLAKK